MKKSDKQEDLIRFAMDEISKIMNDIQNGKTPTMSPKAKKLQEEVNKIAGKEMSEDELEKWTNEKLKDI